MDKYLKVAHPIDPVFDSESKTLILGSFPSVKSREAGFYYMNKTNRFYDVVGSIYGIDFKSLSIERKIETFKSLGIAIYDSILECEIIGSRDSTIRNVVPSNIEGMVESSKIDRIFLNGQKSYDVFVKYHPSLRHIAYKLPSTSFLNARYGLPELIREWSVIRKIEEDVSIGFDLDGTLADSYEVISSSLKETADRIGYQISKEEALAFAKEKSASELIHLMSSGNYNEVKELYSKISDERIDEIGLFDGALELIRYLYFKGYSLFIYTHRGDGANRILRNNNLDMYFREVVTSSYGLKRKPGSDGIDFLIDKYGIDRSNFIYVGDRKLDIECASSASVKSILVFSKETGIETYHASTLGDIRDIIDNIKIK